MKMIILPIKKKWFDLILSGVKKEEYREIKPYYDRRFKDLVSSGEQFEAFFRNGYCAKSPSFVAICTVDIGTGEPSKALSITESQLGRLQLFRLSRRRLKEQNLDK